MWDATDSSDEDSKPSASDHSNPLQRVTVWNPSTGKKLSGNAGVFKKNLANYLRTHPEWSVWHNDKQGHGRNRPQKRKLADREDEMDPDYRDACVIRHNPCKKVEDLDQKPSSSEQVRSSVFDHVAHRPATLDLWRSLLDVCARKAILAHTDVIDEVDADVMDQTTNCEGDLAVNDDSAANAGQQSLPTPWAGFETPSVG